MNQLLQHVTEYIYDRLASDTFCVLPQLFLQNNFSYTLNPFFTFYDVYAASEPLSQGYYNNGAVK